MLHPVQLDLSLIGQPLPWDLFTDSGVLVAGAGLVIADEAHFFKLIGRPLYRKSDSARDSGDLLDRLEDRVMRAAELLASPVEEGGVLALETLTRDLTAVFRADQDACLGYPVLARIARPSMVHCIRVMFVSLLLADHMEFSESEHDTLACAALTMNMADLDLHDRLGEHGTAVLGPDRDRLLTHPVRAVDLLRRAGVDNRDWLDAVRQHHENMDGTGYPDGLAGSDIGMAARILRVADTYCARIAGRHYHPPKSGRYALQELFGREHGLMDTQIAVLLLRLIGRLPPGTLVRLANRESACITRRARSGGVRFAVSFLDGRGRLLENPRERDLTSRLHRLRAVLQPEPSWPKVEWKHLWGY